MSEVHRLPHTDDIEREASEWIARLNADDVSADDEARFEAWCRAHPWHARVYDELVETWGEFKDAGQIVRAVSFGNAMNTAASLPLPRSPGEGREGVFRVGASFAIAATVAVLAFCAGWYFLRSTPATQFQTALGEHASVQLPDGSSLELNSNSLARIDYSSSARIIRLARGEAFFNVAHDPQHPFWVIAGDSWIRAVGTAFNVYLRPNGAQVTVSEGTVKVAAERFVNETPSDVALGHAAVSIVTAGQQADVLGPSAKVHSLPPAAIARSVAWRQGSLYFENQPLGEVIDVRRDGASRAYVERAEK